MSRPRIRPVGFRKSRAGLEIKPKPVERARRMSQEEFLAFFRARQAKLFGA